MAYIDNNNITFHSFDSNISTIGKKVGNKQYVGVTVDDLADIASDNDGTLPTTINAIEIDWNGAQVNGATINTIGDLLSKIATFEALAA